MLHTGTGVPRDQRAAFELYQAAGEMGSIDGWKNVVACYTTGEGVPQSLETAQYITKTILKGENTDSQWLHAICAVINHWKFHMYHHW